MSAVNLHPNSTLHTTLVHIFVRLFWYLLLSIAPFIRQLQKFMKIETVSTKDRNKIQLDFVYASEHILATLSDGSSNKTHNL